MWEFDENQARGATPIIERVARLEGETDLLKREGERREADIVALRSDLITGLGRQESLMREMVTELRSQHAELRNAHDRMSSFARGVLWLGSISTAGVVALAAVATAAGSLTGPIL